jgi:hypothetical protein
MKSSGSPTTYCPSTRIVKPSKVRSSSCGEPILVDISEMEVSALITSYESDSGLRTTFSLNFLPSFLNHCVLVAESESTLSSGSFPLVVLRAIITASGSKAGVNLQSSRRLLSSASVDECSSESMLLAA